VPTSEPVDISSYLDETTGKVKQAIPTLWSGDEEVALQIPFGATALQGDKTTPLLTIQMVRVTGNIPDPPEDHVIVGYAYDVLPSGANFSPPVTIEMSYDPDDVPGDVNTDDLEIASYDVTTEQWEKHDSSPHPDQDDTVTAKVRHFTIFAILANTVATALNSWVIIGPILWLALIGLITLGLLRFY
jgi:hypothetical protein